MSQSSFTACTHCGKLNIYGARCVCQTAPQLDCDCTYSGNAQHIGPKCQDRIDRVWSATIATARKFGGAA